MERKRDSPSIILEAICWIALMGAEFFFLLSYLPWELLWVFLILTLLVSAFALFRRLLWRQKLILRTAGMLLAVFSLTTGWFCFSDASQVVGELWFTEDLAHYERLAGGPFSGKDSEMDFFPYPIPEYASETKFHYNPQILQGGSEFSLEFRAPREEAKRWETFFKEQADYPGSYLDQGVTASDMAKLMKQPQEFKIYVLYARTQVEGDNPSLDNLRFWNHGELKLGAVNHNTGRVYFYQSVW